MWLWVLELAEGLDYLHSNGIVHRDIKTENILVDENNHAKWADLGVSQVDDLLVEDAGVMAENNIKDRTWASPEEMKPGARGTARSDVFSLGLVIWQVLTGRPIWTEDENNRVGMALSCLKEGEERVKQVLAIPNCTSQGLTFTLKENNNSNNSSNNSSNNNNIAVAVNKWKKLIYSCWSQKPEHRPLAKDIVKYLKQNASELCGYHYNSTATTNTTLTTVDIDAVVAVLKNEGLLQIHSSSKLRNQQQYVIPYVRSEDVQKDWDEFWTPLEGKLQGREEKEQKEEKQDEMKLIQPIDKLFDGFLQLYSLTE